MKCYACGTTDRPLDTCPLCGAVVCLLCAEREGEFCCDDAECAAPTPGDDGEVGP